MWSEFSPLWNQALRTKRLYVLALLVGGRIGGLAVVSDLSLQCLHYVKRASNENAALASTIRGRIRALVPKI